MALTSGIQTTTVAGNVMGPAARIATPTVYGGALARRAMATLQDLGDRMTSGLPTKWTKSLDEASEMTLVNEDGVLRTEVTRRQRGADKNNYFVLVTDIASGEVVARNSIFFVVKSEPQATALVSAVFAQAEAAASGASLQNLGAIRANRAPSFAGHAV